MMTLVIYDISDDRLRGRLAEYLRQYGLEHIQYSGFMGRLNANDRHVLVREVKRFIGGPRDSIYVVPLCNRCLSLLRIVSKDVRGVDEKGEVEVVE